MALVAYENISFSGINQENFLLNIIILIRNIMKKNMSHYNSNRADLYGLRWERLCLYL